MLVIIKLFTYIFSFNIYNIHERVVSLIALTDEATEGEVTCTESQSHQMLEPYHVCSPSLQLLSLGTLKSGQKKIRPCHLKCWPKIPARHTHTHTHLNNILEGKYRVIVTKNLQEFEGTHF